MMAFMAIEIGEAPGREMRRRSSSRDRFFMSTVSFFKKNMADLTIGLAVAAAQARLPDHTTDNLKAGK
jgi:hypothetical protein